ncbi:ABC transporter permease [Desulfosarcina alkanivorans]|uniref:ABC transporter permease n=1 Tax=Desulfosarcina alkanivorans TaxID=571177 RepID=A0A5K7YGH5_9BACT|nr:TRAP transporter small permease [Desulfosarcina alkanivorans]BBO68186.1 ABC transporter permease [Desulfosarcina alkanivorans]
MTSNSIYPLIFTITAVIFSSLLFLFPYGRERKSSVLTTIDRWLSRFEEWTLLISVGVALIALFLNVVLRYGFNYTLAWSEELVREVIIYTTFIGCCVAVKNRSMIKIDASVQLLPKLKPVLTHFSNGVILIFSTLMMYYGWQMAALQARTFQKTLILQIPLVYLYAILPLTGVLMFLRTLLVMHHDVTQSRVDA